MKRLRRVTEAEVIAEFLKNEFYQEEFHHDREQFEQLVLGADLRTNPVMPCAGPSCFAAAGTCGESCRPTPNGGKCKSSRRTWSGYECFPGRSGARWPTEASC